jgi:hypothetical protein
MQIHCIMIGNVCSSFAGPFSFTETDFYFICGMVAVVAILAYKVLRPY